MNDHRSDFGDRLDALAADATHATHLRHPAVRSTAAPPLWGKLAWATAVLLLVVGGLVWWRVAADDNPSGAENDQTITTDQDGDGAGPGPAEGEPAEEGSGPESPGSACSVDEALDLLRSGLPTYDYEPAGSYRDAADRAQYVVTGTIESARRVDAVPGTAVSAFTELTVVDVVDLDGQPVPEIEIVAYESFWADRDNPDPLAEAVSFDGLRFIGFLTAWSGVRGDHAPGVEGLYVACGDGATSAVVASAAGPDDPISPTVAELAELVAADTDNEDEAGPEPGTAEPTTEPEMDDLPSLEPACTEDTVAELADAIDPGIDFDYQPAGSVAALADMVGTVVTGEVTFVQQVENTGPLPDDAFIVVTMAGVEHLAGADLSIERFSIGSVRPGGPETPLQRGIEMPNVPIVVFLFLDERVEGGAIPAVEGVYIACDRTTPALAVFESAAGGDDPAEPTLDDLVRLVRLED